MALSFSAAASARASCQKRSPTLSATITAITDPARASPVRKDIADKVESRMTSGLRMILRTWMGQPCFFSCATSFGPVFCARSSASAWVSPAADVPKSRSSASPSFRAASRTAGETRILWFLVFVAIAGLPGWAGGAATVEPSVPESQTETPALPFELGVAMVLGSLYHMITQALKTGTRDSRMIA